MESDQSLGFAEVSELSGLSGTKRVCEGSGGVGNDGKSYSVNKKTRVSEKVDDDQEGKKEEEPVLEVEIDLNVSIMKGENGVDDLGECNQIGHGIDLNGPIREIIDISSDDDDDDEMLGNPRDDKGKGKECTMGLDLQLGIKEGGGDDVGGSSSVGGQRRYTREEKGKAKIEDWLSLSLANNMRQGDLDLSFELDKANQIFENKFLLLEDSAIEALVLIKSMQVNQNSLNITENQERERAFRIEKARDFEKGSPEGDFWYRYERQKNKVKNPSNEAQMKLEEFSGSFSDALKAIIDRNNKQKAEELIEWNACRSDFQPPHAPSLLDLSLNVLAKNADAISSLDHVPEWLKRRLTDLLCDTDKMNIHMLELLCKGSPTEIRVKNCSWMAEGQVVNTLGKSDMQNLRVLQLDFCGRCSFDDIICNSLAQSSNSMPCLGILSLRGAGRLSDNTLKPLLVSAPLLQSINLGQCALLTCDGIKILADSLKTNLKELYIDDCLGIDAMRSLPSMKKFKHLEVLSVAGILSVCDGFVRGITAACGGNLKELNLANCMRLTDRSLEAIGNCCPRLCLLNISNLNKLTDLGICYLANGCRSLESLDVSRAELSDEAVAAFLETAGGSLKVLSLNHVRQISFNTAFSLAKCSRKLVGLDLSWCRRITDEALGYIIDNCSSLELLKIFGCTQITDGFLFSYSNSRVRIVGRDLAPLLEHANMFEPIEVLLHHSPLLACSGL